jgi:hypothetical protein
MLALQLELCSPGLIASCVETRWRPSGFRPGFWPQGQSNESTPLKPPRALARGAPGAPKEPGSSRERGVRSYRACARGGRTPCSILRKDPVNRRKRGARAEWRERHLGTWRLSSTSNRFLRVRRGRPASGTCSPPPVGGERTRCASPASVWRRCRSRGSVLSRSRSSARARSRASSLLRRRAVWLPAPQHRASGLPAPRRDASGRRSEVSRPPLRSAGSGPP